MNVVAFGGGTNSAAMVAGMYERGIPIDLILHADPGGEWPHTYQFIDIFSEWLAAKNPPEIVTVYCTTKDGKRLTLEDECLL